MIGFFVIIFKIFDTSAKYMSYFANACKTERQNGISHLIFELLRTLNSSLRDHLFMLQNEVFRTT